MSSLPPPASRRTSRRAHRLAAVAITASVALAGTLSASGTPASASDHTAHDHSAAASGEELHSLFEGDQRVAYGLRTDPGRANKPVVPASRPKGKAKVKVRLTAKDVGVDTLVKVKGKAPGSKRKVILEHKTKRGWQKLKTKKSNKKGKFKLQVDTSYYGKHKMRVFVPRTRRKPAGTSKSFAVRVSPAYAPAGSKREFAFFPRHPRFNPCQTITYRVNPTNAPANADALVANVLDAIHKASGLDFRSKGTTDAVPFNKPGDRGGYAKNTKLTVAWSDAATVTGLGGSVAGLGGPYYYTGRKGPTRTVKAGVVIDREVSIPPNGNPDQAWTLLLLHEIGHAMGLQHVTDGIQIMNPSTTLLEPTIYQAGDIGGLNKLGAAEGCF